MGYGSVIIKEYTEHDHTESGFGVHSVYTIFDKNGKMMETITDREIFEGIKTIKNWKLIHSDKLSLYPAKVNIYTAYML